MKKKEKRIKKRKKSHALLCTTGDTMMLGLARETHFQSPDYKIPEMQKDTYDFLTCKSPYVKVMGAQGNDIALTPFFILHLH